MVEPDSSIFIVVLVIGNIECVYIQYSDRG